MKELELRLQKLERNLRWYKILSLLGISVFILSSFVTPDEVPDIIRARKFELVDETGKVLLKLRKSSVKGEYGSGTIELFNRAGNKIAYMGSSIEHGDGILQLKSKMGKTKIFLGSSKSSADKVSVKLYDDSGKFLRAFTKGATSSSTPAKTTQPERKMCYRCDGGGYCPSCGRTGETKCGCGILDKGADGVCRSCNDTGSYQCSMCYGRGVCHICNGTGKD